MTTVEVAELAEAAGLSYLESGTPGIRRMRRGKGFSYVNGSGKTVNEDARKRITEMSIPPAWNDVWISRDPDSHILVTGIDKAGRKQYIYHPTWEEVRDEIKFSRIEDFGRRVGRLRKALDSDLRRPGASRRKVVALSVAVLDRTLIRVGNRRYAVENESYGLTTLTPDHVEIEGKVVYLDFSGKGGADHQMVFTDRRLASLISRCQDLGGQTLFSYETDHGPSSVTSTDVNDYLGLATGSRFTAKDFRTWGASTTVVESLAQAAVESDHGSAFLSAIDVAAERLGNTREVCRSSYVHPAVEAAFADGRLETAWRGSRTGKWLDRAESALNRILVST